MSEQNSSTPTPPPAPVMTDDEVLRYTQKARREVADNIMGDIKKIGVADEIELYQWAKELRAPIEAIQEIAETGKLPVPMFCAGGISTPADASLVMQLGAEACFVGSGIFKSSQPELMARAIVEATTHYEDASVVARVSTGLGEAMKGLEVATLETRLAERGW